MARKTAHIISCDNPDCDVVVEVNDLHEHPEGWYRVYPNAGARTSIASSSYFDLDSLECISQWAKLREAGLTSVNGDSAQRTATAVRQMLGSTSETNELVLASVETGKDTVKTVATDLGISIATAARHLKALEKEGKLTVRRERLDGAPRESLVYELVKE